MWPNTTVNVFTKKLYSNDLALLMHFPLTFKLIWMHFSKLLPRLCGSFALFNLIQKGGDLTLRNNCGGSYVTAESICCLRLVLF